MEEKNVLKRRNPANKGLGGRPPLEEVTEVTPDMESVAQLNAIGHTVAEIAETLNWTTERVSRHLKLPLVQNRVKLLLGDPLVEIGFKRRRILTAADDSLIRKANRDELSEGKLLEIHRMLDPYERQKEMTPDDKRLSKEKMQLPEGSMVVGSNERKGSIFESKDEE
jgi:hypothetical protein